MDKNNMTVENYTENFCEAIQTLISKSIEGLKFDKTITCTIIDDSSADYGEYTVINSVGNKFQVFGDKKAYKKDDSVFVLIPEGNYSNQKRIVSKADQDNELKKGYQESADTVIPVKKDLVKVKKENSSEDIVNFYLTANENGTKGTTKLIRTFIGPNNSNYIENNSYTRLAIETDITTNFGDLEEYITQGIYGILLKIEGKKEDGAIAQKEFIFNSEEFFGIPYRFAGTPVKQSAVFDISQLKTIQAIEVYIYENGDFYHAKEGYKEFLKNSNKITFSNINLTYGYDIDNYENGDLILTTVSPLIYDIPLGGSGDQKNLSLNFLRVNNLNNLEVVKDLSKTDPTFPFGENYNYLNKLYDTEAFNVYWYRWILSEENQENNNILNESMWQEQTSEQLFSFNFTPESSRPIEKIKTAIVFSKQFKEKTIEKDEDGNYVKEKLKDENGVEIEKYAYSENDYDPLIEINTENIKKDFILKYNSIKVNDDNEKIYRFKVYAYKGDSAEEILGTVGNRDNFESISAALQGSDLSDHIQIKDEDDILVAELNFVDIPEDKKAVYISNEIVFTNNQSKESLELNIIQNEELTLINDDYNGNYFIYDNISHRCAPGAAADKKLKVSFKEYVSEYIKDEDISLIWKIPKNNTMLINKSFRRKDSTGEILNEEFSESDGEENDIQLKEWDNKTDNNFYILEDTPLAVLPEGQTTQVINGVQEYEQFIQFSLKDYFSANASNNFIICEIKRGNKIISVKKDLSFGTMGSNGTNYAFSINLDKSKVFSPVGGMLRKSCFGQRHEIIPHLYNLETKEEIFTYDSFNVDCHSVNLLPSDKKDLGDISVKKDEDDGKFYLYLPKWNDILVNINNYYLCLKATLIYEGYELSTELPVPLSLPDTFRISNGPFKTAVIKEYLGPEVLMYNSSGGDPQCNKNEAQLIGENLPSNIHGGGAGSNNIMIWEVQYCSTKNTDQQGFQISEKNNKNYFPYFTDGRIPNHLTYSNFYYSNYIEEKFFRIVAKRRLDTAQSGKQDTIIYIQPFIITQNVYGSSFLNQWDGNYYENVGDSILLSRVLGAGIKSDDNTFSGVLLGDVKKVSEDNSQIGLYGFNKGVQSFGFKQDGTAFLGKAGSGRIEFDGTKGVIKSWGDKDNPSQMVIDLDGSRDKDGKLIEPASFKMGYNTWKHKYIKEEKEIIEEKKGYTVEIDGDGQFRINAPTEDDDKDFIINLDITKDDNGIVKSLDPKFKLFNNIEFSKDNKYISSGGNIQDNPSMILNFHKTNEDLKTLCLKMGRSSNESNYAVEIFGDGSFNFGRDKIKFDVEKNTLILSDATIEWKSVNEPRKMNLSFLERDLIESTFGPGGGYRGRCYVKILYGSSAETSDKISRNKGDYLCKEDKSIYRYTGEEFVRVVDINSDYFYDFLCKPKPGDPGTFSITYVFVSPNDWSIQKDGYGPRNPDDVSITDGDIWIHPQRGMIFKYEEKEWKETKDYYMNNLLGQANAEIYANTIGQEIKDNLGWSETKIGTTYVLSPYIGGGFLNISSNPQNLLAGNQVIVDPGFISQQGNDKKYIFKVQSRENVLAAFDEDGNAFFSGEINSSTGNIGGWTIDSSMLYKPVTYKKDNTVEIYGLGMCATTNSQYGAFWAGYSGGVNDKGECYNSPYDDSEWKEKTSFYILNNGAFSFGKGRISYDGEKTVTLDGVKLKWKDIDNSTTIDDRISRLTNGTHFNNIDTDEKETGAYYKEYYEGDTLQLETKQEVTYAGETKTFEANTLYIALHHADAKSFYPSDWEVYDWKFLEFEKAIGKGVISNTEISDHYVISPHIGGGYLKITGNNTEVIIDPQLKREDSAGTTVFAIKQGTKDVIKLDKTGDATFEGKIKAVSLDLMGNKIPYSSLSGTPRIPTSIAELEGNDKIVYKENIKQESKTFIDENNGNTVTYIQTTVPTDGGTITYHTYDAEDYVLFNVKKGKDEQGQNYFCLEKNGLLTAKNAVIYGTIYASKGEIGGWSIGQTYLSSGGGYTENNRQAHFINNAAFIIPGGAISPNESLVQANDFTTKWVFGIGTNFGVTKAGKLYAKAGKIGGWDLGGAYLTYGGGIGENPNANNNVNANFNKKEQAFIIPEGYINTSKNNPAKTENLYWVLGIGRNFGVTSDGFLYAVNGTFSGEVNATKGSVGGWDIKSNSVSKAYSLPTTATPNGILGSGLGSTRGEAGLVFWAGYNGKRNETTVYKTPYEEYDAEVEKGEQGNINSWKDKTQTFILNNGILKSTTIRTEELYLQDEEDSTKVVRSLYYDATYGGVTSVNNGFNLASGNRAIYTPGESVYIGASAFRDPTGNSPPPNTIRIGSNGFLNPVIDNTIYLGHSNYRWKQVFAETSQISTSDRKLKSNIKNLPSIYEQFFMELNPVSFTFIHGTSGRTHIGFISQDVENIMSRLGMANLDFAGFCKDAKIKYTADGEELVLDENGNKQYIYSLRYEEFIALNTHMIQKNYKYIQELENKVKILEDKINQLTSN